MNEIYPWQQPVWQHLLDYLRQQRIPQALLISGSAGWGLHELIDRYAASLLCHQPNDGLACGQCRSCKLLLADNHPDYLRVQPLEAGKAILIDQIRDLIGNLALKPQFDSQRLVVIEAADNMNAASANAFLKCLEEPSERTSIVLISEQSNRLPATIRSRCQKIFCPPAEPLLANDWLRQQRIGEHSEQLLRLANGSPLLARDYAENNILEIRGEIFQRWLHLAHGKDCLVSTVDDWLKRERPLLGTLLMWMASWVSDLIKSRQIGPGATLYNTDLKKSLHELAERLELRGLYRFYDSLLQARWQATTQVNSQLLLERLMVEWSQLNSR